MAHNGGSAMGPRHRQAHSGSGAQAQFDLPTHLYATAHVDFVWRPKLVWQHSACKTTIDFGHLGQLRELDDAAVEHVQRGGVRVAKTRPLAVLLDEVRAVAARAQHQIILMEARAGVPVPTGRNVAR